MMPRHSLRPVVIQLENRLLLTNYNRNISAFWMPNSQIVLKSGDASGHSAWGFPGMQFGVNVYVPTSYRGFASITYTITPEFSGGPLSRYDLSLGQPDVNQTRTITYSSIDHQQDMEYFNLPKGATGDVVISIDVNPYTYTGTGVTTPDHLFDSLTVTIEQPTINSFVVGGATDPNSVASPLQWIRFPDGTMGFAMGNLIPDGSIRPASVGFWASVTNTTHYKLQMGFVQIAPSFSAYSIYTDTSQSKHVNAQHVVDNWPTQQTYLYADFKQQIDSQILVATPQPVAIPADPTQPVTDWPHFQQRTSRAVGATVAYLTSISFDALFETSLVVSSGWIAGGNGSPPIPGIPIALSTAPWELHGHAFNTNTNDPANPTWSVTTTVGLPPPPPEVRRRRTALGPRLATERHRISYGSTTPTSSLSPQALAAPPLSAPPPSCPRR